MLLAVELWGRGHNPLHYLSLSPKDMCIPQGQVTSENACRRDCSCAVRSSKRLLDESVIKGLMNGAQRSNDTANKFP